MRVGGSRVGLVSHAGERLLQRVDMKATKMLVKRRVQKAVDSLS